MRDSWWYNHRKIAIMRLSIERIKIMKKFKKLLSVMAIGVLLITNVVSVSAAEKEQPAKIESLSEIDLEAYIQELLESGGGIQLYGPAPALTQFR